jgi:hypothetical protein
MDNSRAGAKANILAEQGLTAGHTDSASSYYCWIREQQTVVDVRADVSIEKILRGQVT